MYTQLYCPKSQSHKDDWRHKRRLKEETPGRVDDNAQKRVDDNGLLLAWSAQGQQV